MNRLRLFDRESTTHLNERPSSSTTGMDRNPEMNKFIKNKYFLKIDMNMVEH